MRARLAWLCWCFCLGCHGLKGVDAQPGEPHSPWEMGQNAMRAGDPDEAIARYQEALSQKEPDPRHYLSLAAAHVAKGDEAAASLALAHYIQVNPDHYKARSYYAELLRRLGKNDEAQFQFERTVADLQQETTVPCAQLVHCHGRLMELAEDREDDYEVHLHRGIGLYWLAQESRDMAAANEGLNSEGLWCKAAAELSLAHAARPQQARPSWYLYSVWRCLAQTHLAQRCLRDAQEAAPFTLLTPAEYRSLEFAGAASTFPRPGT
ncbi:MAG TPA: tetratricopeptide repeat protein [Gemmataceae bacterium]|jgi:tetratricopeptide (TPR) repeat protein|nr:tetratricopeptide repeat protein [Gemmataceae bacterium]